MGRQGGRVLEGVRVLLVEDTDDAREAFAALLQTEGANVTSAATGREALARLEHADFDAVVTDLGLPDIPGELLIREVLARGKHPFILVATGFGDPYAQRSKDAGADVVLTKPVDWTVLLRHLQRAVRREAGRIAA